MNKTIACCLVGLILVIAIEAIYLEWVPPSPPGFTEHQYNRDEAAEPKSPVPASERTLEQAAAIPSSPSLAREPVDRQEVTVSSSPPVPASERNLETGGRDTELTFARTGTSRSARGDGFIKPTGAWRANAIWNRRRRYRAHLRSHRNQSIGKR